jgi:hypothetical protein
MASAYSGWVRVKILAPGIRWGRLYGCRSLIEVFLSKSDRYEKRKVRMGPSAIFHRLTNRIPQTTSHQLIVLISLNQEAGCHLPDYAQGCKREGEVSKIQCPDLPWQSPPLVRSPSLSSTVTPDCVMNWHAILHLLTKQAYYCSIHVFSGVH